MKRSPILAALLLSCSFGSLIAADDTEIESRPTAGRDHTLRLGGFEFDPLVSEPALPEGWERYSTLAPDLHLVQFEGPIRPEELEALRDAGMQPVQYIHPNTYIVWGRRAQRLALEREASVRWTGDFAPAYRVAPRWRDLPADTVQARVLVYRGAGFETVLEEIAARGGTLGARRTVTEDLGIVGVELPGDRLQEMSSVRGVYSIQLPSAEAGPRAEASSQISAGNVDAANIAFPGYLSWLAALGLDGSGVVVALVDEGVDEGHPDLSQRMRPCAGDTCSALRSEHGTNTAGIVVGDASTSVIDGAGFLRGLGVAPGARLIEQVWRSTYQQAGGMLALMTDSRNNGASVSNNSWGVSTTAQGYDMNTLLVDAGVRDADPTTPGNQSLIYVQSINNGEGGISSQGSPDEGKNLFTVGSTPALSGPATPDPDIDNLSANTGHGPALDGRTIPHMVAPGCFLDTTKAETVEGFGYAGRCGTSMAAAHVSGAVALFIEYYRGLEGSAADPSPALVKAAFLPVAHDLEGFLDADGAPMGHRPDSKQGWGRLDLAAVLDPAEPVLYFDQTEIFDFSGQDWSRAVTVANPAAPLRIMLVWTDAPGHGLGGNTPAWNNDLDLAVETGGQTYLGNNFGDDGFSVIGGTADAMNNAEGVFLATVTDSATLRVSATDINSNGVPFSGDRSDQDFALVCYNCTLVPDFALATRPARLEVCAPRSSSMDIDVERIAGFADFVTLSAAGVPAGAGVSFSANPVAPGLGSALTLDPGAAVTGDYTLQVQGSAPPLFRSISFGLALRTSPPASPLLTLPAAAAVDVVPMPRLNWEPVPWISRYLVEVATDAGFQSIAYSAVEDDTSHTLRRSLAQQATYYWRVRATNACGYGGISPVFSFTTGDVPDLLLVDDDYDLPDEQSAYTSALDGLGVSYDIWDVWAGRDVLEPDARELAPYDQVIWFSGREEVYAGPNAESEDLALPAWLDRGGCLLISSTDYVLQHEGGSDFMQQRLGVASVVEDAGMSQVTGQGTVFGGLGPYSLTNQNPDYRDAVSPDRTAELAFAGDGGDAGVSKDGGWYRASFLGFGVESTASAETSAILNAFLTWCAGLADVDGDADGVPNGADCAPGDPDAWGVPSPITDLRMDRGAVGFSWSQPVSGNGATYDVLRSRDVNDFYNAVCVAPETSHTWAAFDADDPAPGELFFYQVGAKSACGVSTLGTHLDASPRYGTACDAETVSW